LSKVFCHLLALFWVPKVCNGTAIERRTSGSYKNKEPKPKVWSQPRIKSISPAQVGIRFLVNRPRPEAAALGPPVLHATYAYPSNYAWHPMQLPRRELRRRGHTHAPRIQPPIAEDDVAERGHIERAKGQGRPIWPRCDVEVSPAVICYFLLVKRPCMDPS
jgi:hypothetical protein